MRNIEHLPRVCSEYFSGLVAIEACAPACTTRKREPLCLHCFQSSTEPNITKFRSNPSIPRSLGNFDKTSKHFIVKLVVHQYEALPVEVENDIPQDLDELVSSRQERFVEMRLKYPNTPPDGFLVFDSDGIEVRRWFGSARPKQ